MSAQDRKPHQLRQEPSHDARALCSAVPLPFCSDSSGCDRSCLILVSHLGFQRKHPKIPLWQPASAPVGGKCLSPDPRLAEGSASTTATPSHAETPPGPLLVPEQRDLIPNWSREPQLPQQVPNKSSTHWPSSSKACCPPPSPTPGHIRHKGSDQPHRHTWGGQSQGKPHVQLI